MDGAQSKLVRMVLTALPRNRKDSSSVDLKPADLPHPITPASVQDPHPSPINGTFDGEIVNVLADKILLAWLRNRHQLLFPFAFDLGKLDKNRAILVIHAMVNAAQADGTFEAKERYRIEAALDRIAGSHEIRSSLTAALNGSRPLHEVLAAVSDIQTSALIYAVSLMAVDQRKPVNRHYLRYLGARLQLSEELVGSLEQRFRSSG